MLDKSKLIKALSQWIQVILVKKAQGRNPTSYSLVTRIEWDKVWRTAFEAETPDEVYDFTPWKYTLSKDLLTNERVSLYGIARQRVSDLADEEDDEDCPKQINLGAANSWERNGRIEFLEQEIRRLQNQISFQTREPVEVKRVPAPTKSRLKRVSA